MGGAVLEAHRSLWGILMGSRIPPPALDAPSDPTTPGRWSAFTGLMLAAFLEFILGSTCKFGLFATCVPFFCVTALWPSCPIGWLADIEICFLIMVLVLLRWRGQRPDQLWFRPQWWQVWVAVFWSVVIGIGAIGVYGVLEVINPTSDEEFAMLEVATGMIDGATGAAIPFAVVLLDAVINGFYEELVLLGVPAALFGPRGLRLALIASLAIRTTFHTYQGLNGVVLVLVFGIAQTLLFLRYRSLVIPVLIHIDADF